MRKKRSLSFLLALLTSLSALVQEFVGVTTWSGGSTRIAHLGLGTGLAWAQGPPTSLPPGALLLSPLDHVLDQLDLSSEQRAAIDPIAKAYRQQAETERQAMMTARWELMQTTHAEAFEEAKIREAAATVAALEAEGAVAMAKLFQEIRAVLTPDQQQLLQDTLSRPPMPGGPAPGGHGSRRGSTLSGLAAQAPTASPGLSAARATLREARARHNYAQADRLPANNLSGSSSRYRSGITGGSSTGDRGARGPDTTGGLFSIGFNATWELDPFGRKGGALEAAEAEGRASGADPANTHVSLAAEAALDDVELRRSQVRRVINRPQRDGWWSAFAEARDRPGARESDVATRTSTEGAGTMAPEVWPSFFWLIQVDGNWTGELREFPSQVAWEEARRAVGQRPPNEGEGHLYTSCAARARIEETR